MTAVLVAVGVALGLSVGFRVGLAYRENNEWLGEEIQVVKATDWRVDVRRARDYAAIPAVTHVGDDLDPEPWVQGVRS